MPQTIPSTQLPQKWYAIAVTDPNIAAWYAQLRGDHPDEPKSIIDHMMRSINDYGNGSGPGYDYRTAIEKGLRPSMQPDGKYHWGGDADDVIVKGEQHPTRNLTDQAMTRVQQRMDQNVGRVKKIQKQAEERQQVADSYVDLVKVYPESWSQIKALIKEDVHDLETITKIVRGSALSKRKEEPSKLDFFDKVAEFGHLRTWTDLVPFVSGVADIAEMTELLSAANALENETATPEQVELLQQYVDYSEVDKSWWFKVLDLVSNLPAFAGEIYFTGGIYTAGKKATLETGKAVLGNLITKQGKKKLAAYVSKGAGEIAKKSVAAVGGASLQFVPAGITRIPAETLERMLPLLQLNDEEKLVVAGEGQSAMDALVDATKGQWIEMVSERSGGLFKSLGKPAKEAIARTTLMRSWMKSNPGAKISGFREVLNRVGYHGVINEILEERVAAIARATPGIGTGEEFEDYTSKEFWEQISVEAAGFSVPGAMGVGADIQARRKEKKAEAASIEATAVSRLSPEGVAGVDEKGRKVSFGRPAQLRVEEEGKPAEKRKTETDALSEVDAALDAGETTPGVATLAKHLIGQDPDFDVRSSLEISNEVIKITDDYIRNVLGKEPEQFFEEEGITREEAEEYFATGSTQVDIQKGIAKTAIKLYQGHDADTLVEEWYHDFYEHMAEKDRKAFDAYHKKSKDTRSVEEHFGQEGRDFFFSEKMHEKAGPIRAIFDKARQSLKDLIARIRTIRGAKIPKKIQSIYTAAAERQLTPLNKKQKTDLKKRKLLFQLRTKPKSKEFKSWFGDSKVVDDKGKPLVVYHGTISQDIESFDKKRTGSASTGRGQETKISLGFFFTSDPEVAYDFSIHANRPRFDSENKKFTRPKGAQNIMPVYLSLKNPMIVNDVTDSDSIKGAVDKAKKEGHDGVIFRQVQDATGKYLGNPELYIDGKDWSNNIDPRGMTYDFLQDESKEETLNYLEGVVAGIKEDINSATKKQNKEEVGYLREELKTYQTLLNAWKDDPKRVEVKETGISDVYVAFEPNQIKGQFNEKPTKGPKIMLQARKKTQKEQDIYDASQNSFKYKGKDVFIGVADRRDGFIEQAVTYKTASDGDFHHSFWIREPLDNDNYAVFWMSPNGRPEDMENSMSNELKSKILSQVEIIKDSKKIMLQVKKKKTAFPRVKKTGKYISLPDQINTPQKLFGLVTRLTNMAKEGREGRYWYERSSDVILTAVNGDQKEAQKIAGLVGLFSQANALVPNWRAALRYYMNSKAGKPTEEGRFPGSQVPKAEKIMKGVIPLGIKTNNFYTNLMRHIDPSMKQGVTVDVWMMRALGYKNDAPTTAQYDRASKLITLAADRLGWEPHQVQSAVWTTIKSKWEAVEKKIKAEAISKEHFIVKDKVDGKEIPGHWKNELTRIRYRNKFLKAAFKVPSSEVKALDFADLMLNELSTITMETVPGIENYFSKVNADRDFVQLNDMQVALNRLIIDENGNDRLAQAVGLLVMEDMSAPGAFVEKVSPGRQLTVVAPKGKRGDITGPVEEQIQEYAALFGLLFHQWGVGYHKPMAETTIKRSNLAEVEFDNNVRLTPEETKKFTIAMAKEIETNYGEEHIYDVYLAPASTGYRWINLSDEIQNKDFHNLVDNVTKNTFPKNTYEIVVYKANSNLIYHSEKDAIDNNGKSYKNILSGSQRSEIYRGLLSDLGPQINQVYQDYAKENDWGKAPQKDQKIVFAVRHKRLIPKEKTPKQQALPGSEFLPELELDPERLRDIFQRKIQDKMNRLGHVMGKVKEIRPLSDEEDAYLAAEMYIGKAREKMDNFEDEIYSKKGSLLDRIVKAGYKLEDFGDYLHARHAKERNDHIAKIRDDMPDGGSGMTNKAAAEILEKHKGDKQIEGFANEFYRRVTKRALRARLNADLIDRETYDYLNDYYKHYVPLFVIKDVENRTTPTGKGLSIPQGAELKRAKGSAEERANPVFSGIHEMMGVIRRTEKNKVGLKFLDIAEEFTSESWTVKRQRYKPVYNKYGELEFMDPQFDLGDNVFAVRREGKLHLITINDEALARGLKNLGTEKANKYLMKANNYLRAIVTTWNPEFLITNFARDIQTALIHVVGEHKGVAGTVLKNTPKAMRGVWKNVRGKEANYWSERYDELKKAGGKVGWFDMDTLEEHQVKVEKELQRVQDGKGNARSAARALGDFIESANEAVESGVRLATFEALRKKGMSAERAAQVAKNITVNFNKKGELGTTMNSLYLFFNATIQGSARIGLSFARSKKTRAIMGGIVGMSASISLVNFLIAPDEWEKKNQWEKDNYLIFMLPDGNDIRIRVPYGYNIFHVMGQTAADLIQIGVVEKQGIENLDYGAAIGRILGAASDAFSPFGDGSVIQAISPTLLDPLVQILENKKFHGGPIRPEVPTFVVSDTPNYKQYWDKNPPSWVSRAVTEGLSMITGGGKFEGIKKDKEGNPQDHYMPGWIDINPLDLDHIFGFATGGLGKFVSRSVDTGINFAVGRPTASKDIPFIRQFYGQPDKRAITEKRLIREYISKSKQHHYNHVELARFKRYVYDAIKLGQLTENQAKMVKDENGNEIPKVIRDFLNNQRLTMGLSPIDYRKTGKSRSRTRPTRRRKKK